MRKTALTLLITASLTPLAALAASPSFNCAKATHEAEQMICKDAELARLDRELNSLYEALMANTPAKGRAALKTEQVGWIKGRNDCWKDSDQRGCILDAYEARIDELQDR